MPVIAVADQSGAESVALLSTQADTVALQADVRSAASTTSLNEHTDQPIANSLLRGPYERLYRRHPWIDSRILENQYNDRTGLVITRPEKSASICRIARSPSTGRISTDGDQKAKVPTGSPEIRCVSNGI